MGKKIEQKLLVKQMYIVKASCWKCGGPYNVAVAHGNAEINSGRMYGPELFSEEEMKIAENNDVFIKMQYSSIRQENYLANTCPHCGIFTGQHYLFEYFIGAEYGDFQFKKIDMNSPA